MQAEAKKLKTASFAEALKQKADLRIAARSTAKQVCCWHCPRFSQIGNQTSHLRPTRHPAGLVERTATVLANAALRHEAVGGRIRRVAQQH